jgi:hypothetical protein
LAKRLIIPYSFSFTSANLVQSFAWNFGNKHFIDNPRPVLSCEIVIFNELKKLNFRYHKIVKTCYFLNSPSKHNRQQEVAKNTERFSVRIFVGENQKQSTHIRSINLSTGTEAKNSVNKT